MQHAVGHSFHQICIFTYYASYAAMLLNSTYYTQNYAQVLEFCSVIILFICKFARIIYYL